MQIQYGNVNDKNYGFLCNDSQYGFDKDDLYYETMNHYIYSNLYKLSCLSQYCENISDECKIVFEKIRTAKTPWLSLTIFKKSFNTNILNDYYNIKKTILSGIYNLLNVGIKLKLEQNPELKNRLISTCDFPIVPQENSTNSIYLINKITCQVYEDIRSEYIQPQSFHRTITDLNSNNLDDEQIIIIHNFMNSCKLIAKLEGYNTIYYEMIDDVLYNVIRNSKLCENLKMYILNKNEFTKFPNIQKLIPTISSVLTDYQIKNKYKFEKISDTALVVCIILVWCQNHVSSANLFEKRLKSDRILFPPSVKNYRKNLPTKSLCEFLPHTLSVNKNRDKISITGRRIRKYKSDFKNLGGVQKKTAFEFPLESENTLKSFVFDVSSKKEKGKYIIQEFCDTYLQDILNLYNIIYKYKNSNSIFDFIVTDLCEFPFIGNKNSFTAEKQRNCNSVQSSSSIKFTFDSPKQIKNIINRFLNDLYEKCIQDSYDGNVKDSLVKFLFNKPILRNLDSKNILDIYLKVCVCCIRFDIYDCVKELLNIKVNGNEIKISEDNKLQEIEKFINDKIQEYQLTDYKNDIMNTYKNVIQKPDMKIFNLFRNIIN